MGLRKWLQGPEAPDDTEAAEPTETKPPDDKLEARISGNAVDGYCYNIFRDGRYYQGGGFVPVGVKRNLASVEALALKQIEEIRERDRTTINKVIK